MGKLKKITASTIIESIVAIVIITISLGILLLMLSNLTRRNSPVSKYLANQEAQNTLIRFKSEKLLINETIQKARLRIEARILSYGVYRDIIKIQIQVFDNEGHLIIQKQELSTIK
jgi:type II secretory pathway pseudopilin PulG